MEKKKVDRDLEQNEGSRWAPHLVPVMEPWYLIGKGSRGAQGANMLGIDALESSQ